MRILFVSSQNPDLFYSEQGIFLREYVNELRKYAEVVCVYFRFEKCFLPKDSELFDYVFEPEILFDFHSRDSRILEKSASLRARIEPLLCEFKPDIIHCNDCESFMPFRFDKNVFYSAHLNFLDSIESCVLTDASLSDARMERCALDNSGAVGVYSDYSAEYVRKITGGLCTPLVLPFGNRVRKNSCLKSEFFVADEHFSYSLERKTKNRKIRVSFFEKGGNFQSGINEFVHAVGFLGESFKKKHNVEYFLYRSGNFISGAEQNLFDEEICLSEDEIACAYKNSDVVVILSRYEPFGFTALEAMANGALVLLPKGLGMDMFAEANFNCLEIPHNSEGIAEVLKDAVINFDEYKLLRDNAVRTSRKWTWNRCVKAHLFVYRQILKGRFSELSSAYRKEERKILEKYEASSDAEKLHYSEVERNLILKTLSLICFPFSFEHSLGNEKVSSDSFINLIRAVSQQGKRILILTGSYVPERSSYPQSIEIFSVLNEGEEGITIRPECLPFDDEEFDVVIMCGSWEAVCEPCGALVEAERVCKSDVIVLAFTGFPHAWQIFQVENDDDWEKLTGKNWPLVKDERFCFGEDVPYKAISFRKVKSLKTEDEITA